jgi:hypothetical protein
MRAFCLCDIVEGVNEAPRKSNASSTGDQAEIGESSVETKVDNTPY